MAQDKAAQIAKFISQNDRLFDFLEARVIEAGQGYAKVSMKVKDKHLNAAGICQGGVIFTLCDLAFAISSNSYGKLALAVEASINFTRAVKLGEHITATAEEFSRTRKTAVYIVTVENESKEKVALFKGVVYIVGSDVITS